MTTAADSVTPRTWSEFHSHPDAHRHASVVDDVQRRHLLVFFPQYEKHLDMLTKKKKTMYTVILILSMTEEFGVPLRPNPSDTVAAATVITPGVVYLHE